MNENGHEQLTNTISVRLTGEEHRALQRQADGEERTLSNYVRKVLRELLNKPPDRDRGTAKSGSETRQRPSARRHGDWTMNEQPPSLARARIDVAGSGV